MATSAALFMSIDCIAMLNYGIHDLRAYFESYPRRMRHHGFAALIMPDLVGEIE